jgi:hypothetical protein
MSTKTGPVPGQEERLATGPSAERRSEANNLTVRYGSIGISAVAAALRYRDAGKNPAYAPVVVKLDPKMSEMAA